MSLLFVEPNIGNQEMLSLKSTIKKVEKLLEDESVEKLTYAALECRLAIERICYERLRLAHDYISHADLKRWQPRHVVSTLLQEVDAKIGSEFTLSISRSPRQDEAREPTLQEYEEMDFVEVGTQKGFDPRRLEQLWNGLSNVALHVKLPTSKNDAVSQYGARDAIKSKVNDALSELKRLDEGTLMTSGFGGKEISFHCICGSRNKRRLELLADGQIVSCINPECRESYEYTKTDEGFLRRSVVATCGTCGDTTEIAMRVLEKLKVTDHLHFQCAGCSETIYLRWKLVQAQKKSSP